MKIQQAVILAGGLGTRLQPIWKDRPKPMFLIHNKPFLEYLVDFLVQNGISEIVILVGYKHEVIEDYFGDGTNKNISIKYSYSPIETNTGTRILNALPLLRKTFLLLYGDNFCPLDINKLYRFYVKQNKPAMVTVYSNPHKERPNNIFVNTDGIVEKYDKSRQDPLLNGIDIGFYILRKSLFNTAPKQNFSIEEFAFGDLIKKKKLVGFITPHNYYTLTSPERIPAVKEFFSNIKNQQHRMKIFITGGTGFIGKPLVELLKKNHDLLLLSRKNIPHINTVIGDLANIDKWNEKVKQFKPDVCIHLAWEGIPDYGKKMSDKNLAYGRNLYSLMSDIDCKKIITTGSCWEYDQSNYFTEAKINLRLLGEKIAKENEMIFIWLRLFYVYGPGQKKTSLIPHIIESCRKGIIPELKNPYGANDFIYVEDVAKAIEKSILFNKSVNVDIGSGKLTSIREILHLISKYYNVPQKNNKKTIMHPHSKRMANVTKIKQTDWRPQFSIKNGIIKTLRFYEDILP